MKVRIDLPLPNPMTDADGNLIKKLTIELEGTIDELLEAARKFGGNPQQIAQAIDRKAEIMQEIQKLQSQLTDDIAAA